MPRISKRSLRHPTLGYARAKRATAYLAQQCAAGLPLRTARKVLRKLGIHPWSLLSTNLEAAVGKEALSQWRLPGWMVNAMGGMFQADGMQDVYLQQLSRGVRLPEGLVMGDLSIYGCKFLRRLPRRLWCASLDVRGCPSLDRLDAPLGLHLFLQVGDCRALRDISSSASSAVFIQVENCQSLSAINLVQAPGAGALRLSLSRLPRLERVGKRSVKELDIWDCPRLMSLDGLAVSGRAEIHRCAVLKAGPRFDRETSGHLTDCPGLAGKVYQAVEVRPPQGLKYEPLRGTCRLDLPETLPSVHRVETPSLFPPEDLEEQPFGRKPTEPPPAEFIFRNRILELMGMHWLQRLHSHVRPGLTLTQVFTWHFQRSAGQGVPISVDGLFYEIVSRRDAEAAQAFIQAVDAVGVGFLSVWVELSPETREAALELLPGFWLTGLARVESLEDFTDLHGQIQGPIALQRLVHRRGPRAISGSLWSNHGLDIFDCTELEELPEQMEVQGNLVIADCPALKVFPKRLLVEGNLELRNLPRLARSVCRAQVSGSIQVQGAPALKLAPWGSWEQ